MRKTNIYITAGGTIVLGGMILLACFLQKPENNTISSTGGSVLHTRLADEHYFYLQRDPRWGSETIGGSGESLASVGCTVCSVAMTMSDLGIPTNPSELNTLLKEHNGFTGKGRLVWNSVEELSQGAINIEIPYTISHAELDAHLEKGDIPVAMFYLLGGVSHWVEIVGKSGLEYLAKDPLYNDKQIVKLSELTDSIVSLRYITRKK